MNFVFGILGIVGGLLCAVGDMLFDIKGKDNQKLGRLGIIDSNWCNMAPWRFKASILFAAVGVPLYLLGMLTLGRQIALTNAPLGLAFCIFAIVGACGGFFIHAFVCIWPVVCLTVQKKTDFETVDELTNRVFGMIKIPFVGMFCSLVVATSVVFIVAIARGDLQVPASFYVLNPFVLMLVGQLFRLVNRKIFHDLPGIIMPSMGLAMFGMAAAISSVG